MIPRSRALYFVNAPVDFAVIGGMSLVAFLALWGLELRTETPTVWALAAGLSWVVNWPHFSATNYRLYHSRANISQYPITALVIPFLLMAALLASFHSAEGVAPFFIKLFMIWSPYHFSGQSLGITLIYAKRAGFPVSRMDRLALSGFIYGTFVSGTARGEVGTSPQSYFDVQVPTLGLPQWVADWAMYGMYLCGAIFLCRVVVWCVRERRWIPPIVLLPALSQYIWFIPGGEIPRFNEFVPLFHSLQYLLIAWSMQIKERLDESGRPPSHCFVLRESLVWGTLNIMGGIVLFYLLPKLATGFGYAPGFSEAVVVSTVQIHHFFVDGVIWKLKNPKVSSPLLVNIEDFLRPAPAMAGSSP
jgi:hypothetical protein